MRGNKLHLPHHSLERFGERLARHGDEPGWETVIAFADDEPVGYDYVNTLQPDDRWWRRIDPPVPEERGEKSTMALKEIMLRVPWRGTGVARRTHDDLLAGRPEKQVSSWRPPWLVVGRSRRCTSAGAIRRPALSNSHWMALFSPR